MDQFKKWIAMQHVVLREMFFNKNVNCPDGRELYAYGVRCGMDW